MCKHDPDAGLADPILCRTGGEAACPVPERALLLANDSLAQVWLDAPLIHDEGRVEAWQAGLNHLYQAMINLFAARHALETDTAEAVDAATLHKEVMRHLGRQGGATSPAQIEKLVTGDLREVQPMGRLILFAALLRETTLAWEALDGPAAGIADDILISLGAKLRLLRDYLVDLADPLISEKSRG